MDWKLSQLLLSAIVMKKFWIVNNFKQKIGNFVIDLSPDSKQKKILDSFLVNSNFPIKTKQLVATKHAWQ